MSKNLLLLGGGHAHVHVLKSIASKPIPGTTISLISPFPRQVYSGMLPGWVAGHYDLTDCIIPLIPLAEGAGAVFLETAATKIDFATQNVICANGHAVPFDILSIDTGSAAPEKGIPGAAEHAIAIRPIERFIEAYIRLRAGIEAYTSLRQQTHIVFVGAGLGGCELALAMHHAFRQHNVGFTLISAADFPPDIGPRLKRILNERGIGIMAGQAVAHIASHELHLQSGGIVEADFIVVATGPVAASWPGQSGLRVDESGFILTNACLQSVSHPNVFAVGDCASIIDAAYPKSGVYAVRAGPPLETNLRNFLGSHALKPYRPQSRALSLVSTGNRYALASWGNFTWEGAWAWHWKNKIDRDFMRKYQNL